MLVMNRLGLMRWLGSMEDARGEAQCCAARDEADLSGRRSVVHAERRRRPSASAADSNDRFCHRKSQR